MSLLSFLHIFCLLLYAYMAVFVFYRNPKSLLNKSCAVLMACFSIWNFADAFSHGPGITKDTAMLFQNIASIGWISFASPLLWYSLAFCKKGKVLRSKIFRFVTLFLPLFLIYKQWTNCLTTDAVQRSYGWEYAWANTFWTYLFYTYYVSFTLLAIYFVYRYGKKTEKLVEKTQAKIIVSSIVISLIVGTITDVLLPQLNIQGVPALGNVFILIFAAGLVYAIAKYRFLTITPVAAAENIISTMTDCLILIDKDGEIVTVNRATLNLLGYEESELIGKSAKMLFEEEFDENLLDKTIRTKEPISSDCAFKTKNGENIPVILSSSVLRDEAGEILGFVYIAKDITERKRAEKELRESEEKFRNLSDEISEGVAVTIEAKNYWVNKAFCEIFGYTKEEMIGKGPELVIVPEEVPILMGRLRARMAGEDAQHFYETVAVRKNGSRINIDVSVKVITFEGKKAVQITARDITERKLAEKELIRLSSAVKMSTDSIVISDLEGKILEVNEATLQMFGTDDKKDLIGKSSFVLIVPEEQERAFAGMQEVLQKGFSQNIEYHIITKNGKVIPVEMSIAIMKGEDGRPMGFVGISRDITERRKMVRALRESEENFRSIFQSVPESLLALDNQMKILNSNEAFAKLIRKHAPALNMSEDELRKKILSKLKGHYGKTKHGIIEIGIAPERKPIRNGSESNRDDDSG